jgi:hypothetical protein
VPEAVGLQRGGADGTTTAVSHVWEGTQATTQAAEMASVVAVGMAPTRVQIEHTGDAANVAGQVVQYLRAEERRQRGERAAGRVGGREDGWPGDLRAVEPRATSSR